eukprot:TRINITY_DN9698_c0_g1_i1.p1 TRINITY_DN9698_c0_g1~~TRINITY_DN9698_c0_g1_i1.p1  ORF type:complete len:330 (+),score=79.15 TRINITY_DN9698_c0_g1_i1:23-1012(+)
MNTITSQSSIDSLYLVNNISTDIINQSDSDSDGSLSIDEVEMDSDIFNSMDSDTDGLLTQAEIASAINSQLQDYDEMPTAEEFSSLLSDIGLNMPNSSKPSSSSSDFVSEIMSAYDTNGDSILNEDELSILNSEEFSALDSDGDGSVTGDELTAAVDSIAAGATAPVGGGGGGAGASSSSEEDEDYDIMDTNEDGVVSREELEAYYGLDSVDKSSQSDLSEDSTNSSESLDSIKMIFDAIKENSEDSSEDLDISSFSNIMKMVNKESNSNEFNTYVNNLSDNSTSLYDQKGWRRGGKRTKNQLKDEEDGIRKGEGKCKEGGKGRTKGTT